MDTRTDEPSLSRSDASSLWLFIVVAAAAGITWVVGYAVTPFFGNMVASGAFATLSEHTFNNVIMADVTPIIIAAVIAAFMASVFAVRDRLRRDAEGLV